MEFVVLGKYTAAGLGGFAKNPNEDRKAVIGCDSILRIADCRADRRLSSSFRRARRCCSPSSINASL